MPRIAKETIRKMLESSRKLARLLNELDSTSHKLRNLIPDIVRLERDSEAFIKASEIMKPKPKPKTLTPTDPAPHGAQTHEHKSTEPMP